MNDIISNTVLNIEKFPTTKEMSQEAFNIYKSLNKDIITENNIDTVLIDLLDIEFKLFKAIENKLYLNDIRNINNMDDFISTANSLLNRRKSRAGKSLENFMYIIFNELNIPFSAQCKTEKSKPDFIFPSIDYYNSQNANPKKMALLACKTTLKERWSQVLTEGEKIPVKHLLTLQKDISSKTLDNISSHNIVLVTPYYSIYNRSNIISVKDFIKHIKKYCN